MNTASDPPRTGTDARILIVDDEPAIRHSLSRLLGAKGYQCTTASDAAEARCLLDSETFDLMLCDVLMPGESGFSLLAHVHDTHPGVAVIMVTAIDSPNAADPAARYGAYGYIIKPFDANAILINVVGALRRRADEIERNARSARLEMDFGLRSTQLEEALASLEREERSLSESQEETVLRLALAAESRDPVTGDHLTRMSDYSARLAALQGMKEKDVERFRLASQMHDIGKIGLPDSILLKPGLYSPEDRLIMQHHPEIGFHMLAESNSPLLQLGSLVALTHHEKFDGTGYPKGLVGTQIPIEGRIVAIADVYDALRSERPYKPAFPKEHALAIMKDGRGSHFDPDLMDLFVDDVGNDPDS